MVVAYLPKEDPDRSRRLQPAAGDGDPPNPPSPYTVSLVDHIRRLNLDVQRIAPIHYPADNRVVMDELTKWIARPATN
jgi:hypothetical protein